MSYRLVTDRVAGSGTFFVGTAGETLDTRKLVYLGVNGRWYLADADAVATMPVIGLTMHAVTTGSDGYILRAGFIGLLTWTWTVGGELYASSTAGELTQTPPTGTIQMVGVATQTTQISFDPGAGGGGGTGCAVLEGATAYVGFDDCKEPFANYFLCDGTADDVQIQAAIDYVDVLGGGLIKLERGTFNTITRINIANSNLSIRGCGVETLIEATALGVFSYLILLSDGVENVDISHLSFYANLAAGNFQGMISGTDTTKNIHIHNCKFTSKTYSALPIPTNATDACMVRAVTVSATAIDWKIYDNFISQASIEALSIGHRAVEGDNTGPRYCEVVNNYIENSRMGIAIEKGAKYTLCQGNEIRSLEDDVCILLRHAGTTDNLIVDNIMVDGYAGVRSDRAIRNTVKDNYIYNMTSSGITLLVTSNYNKIDNNVIYKVGAAGIYVSESLYNEINYNTIKYCQTEGIYITERQRSVFGNHIAYTQSHGMVLITNAEGTPVEYNVIGNVTNRCIYANHGSAGELTPICDNIFYEDQADDATTLVGGYLAGVSVFTVVDSTDFEIGEAIQTQPTGFANEDHIISEIDYVENIITIEGVLANNHTAADPVVGIATTIYGVDEEAGTDYDIILRNYFDNIPTPVNIEGANTILATKTLPFIAGGDVEGTAIWASFVSATASAKGWSVAGADDWAVALGQLPLELQQIIRFKIWAVALGAPIGTPGQMHLEIVMNAGADDLAFTTEPVALANFDSVTTDYVNTDVIHWVVDSGDDADIGSMVGGMSIEVKVIYDAGDDPDGATNAIFRTVEIEYV